MLGPLALSVAILIGGKAFSLSRAEHPIEIRIERPVLPAEVRQVVVEITVDDAIEVDGKLVPRDQLGRELKAAAMIDPDTLLVIRAGQEVPFDGVVSVLNLAKEAGLQNVSFASPVPPE